MNSQKDHTPPNLALRFLRWFCPTHLHEEIEGDLIQKFNRDLKASDTSKVSDTYALRRAKRRLLWNVIRFFRPGILLRNKTNLSLTHTTMLTNYFKVASRVMLRNKSFSFINIFGLALGMSSAALLFLWIEREFSYDQFHENKEKIFVAWNRENQNGQIQCESTTPRVLAPTLAQEYAGVESAVSYAAYGNSHLFTVGEKRLVKTSGVFTDPQFLTMFSFPMLKGEPSKALGNPNSIILTESFATQLFGDKEAFGQTLSIGESGYTFQFTVTGILKDLPTNTDFHFDYLVPFQFVETTLGEKDTFWGNNSVITYVKLREGENINHFNEIVKTVAKKHSDKESSLEIFLHPLTKMRLYSRFENGVQSGGRIEIIRMLGILGICLVAIACINFVNLSTARAQKRAKEVGIRKVTGAFRYSLVIQFLCESVLIAWGAGVLSLAFVFLSLPWFSNLINQPLSLDFQNLSFWATAFVFITTIGLLAGVYPAFYLSSFHPVRILKGSPITAGNRNFLRQSLVVLQFGFAVTMIVSVIVVRKQIGFVQNREAGYAKDHLIYQPATGELKKNYAAYKRELLALRTATSVTFTSAPITEQWSGTMGILWKGKDPQEKTDIERFIVDEDIATTAGIAILVGRDMDLQRYPSDSTAVLLNEAAAKLMGFAQPVGEIITDDGIEFHVIGVVKDFVLLSPYQKIMPIVLQGCKRNMSGGSIHIRLNPTILLQENIDALAKLSAKYNPAYPFEYHFVDVEYERKFSGLKTTLVITGVFSTLAIIIACLGLLGLSTFMIESRVKEIGIRKVMGGSVWSITKLLSFSSLKPIFIAIILFSPMGWLSMSWWLRSFAYRISLDGWVFLFAALSIIAIALSITITQTIRAAKINPVDTLRND
jgi:putative ABC transport system permease protein